LSNSSTESQEIENKEIKRLKTENKNATLEFNIEITLIVIGLNMQSKRFYRVHKNGTNISHLKKLTL
jgi:hypothetical protein